jgi:Rrf2 family protein
VSGVLKLSEAAVLALHAMAALAGNGKRPATTREIAESLKASEAHLSKVLQRLHKAGLVQSARGRQGGYTLGKPAGRISLLEVYEAIEGKVVVANCLFGRPVCNRKKCILGGVLCSVDGKIKKYLSSTRLSEFTEKGKEEATR